MRKLLISLTPTCVVLFLVASPIALSSTPVAVEVSRAHDSTTPSNSDEDDSEDTDSEDTDSEDTDSTFTDYGNEWQQVNEGDVISPDQKKAPFVRVTYRGEEPAFLEMDYGWGWRRIRTTLMDYAALYIGSDEEESDPSFGQELRVPIVYDEKNRPLAMPFGTRMRFVVGGRTIVNFRTAATGIAGSLATISYDHTARGRMRQMIASRIRSSRPQARRLIAPVLGRLVFQTHKGGPSQAWGRPMPIGGRLLFPISMNRQHLTLGGALSRHITMHEIGHIVDFSGIPARGRAEFQRAFRKSGRFPRCTASNQMDGARCDPAEVFAENFAFWATGARTVRTGYQIAPAVTPARFGRLIGKWFRFTPGTAGWNRDNWL